MVWFAVGFPLNYPRFEAPVRSARASSTLPPAPIASQPPMSSSETAEGDSRKVWILAYASLGNQNASLSKGKPSRCGPFMREIKMKTTRKLPLLEGAFKNRQTGFGHFFGGYRLVTAPFYRGRKGNTPNLLGSPPVRAVPSQSGERLGAG